MDVKMRLAKASSHEKQEFRKKNKSSIYMCNIINESSRRHSFPKQVLNSIKTCSEIS